MRIFVLAGTERAMVVDTGMTGLDIRSLVGGDPIHSKADRRRQSDSRGHCGGCAGRDAWTPDFDLRYWCEPVLLRPADILRREMKSKWIFMGNMV